MYNEYGDLALKAYLKDKKASEQQPSSSEHFEGGKVDVIEDYHFADY